MFQTERYVNRHITEVYMIRYMSRLVSHFIPPIPKSEIDELEEEDRVIILRYITPLYEAISNLLECDDNEFEYNFERAKTQLLVFSVLVVMTLGEDHFMTLTKKHLELSSQQRRIPQVKQVGTSVVQPWINANEIIVDFLRLTFDTEYREFLPEYADAFVPLLNLIVYCNILLYIVENKSKSESRNISRIIRECEDTAGALEGWVDTIEIETDPEQRAILERVKQTLL